MRLALAAIALVGCAGWDAEPRARTLASQALRCDAVELEARGESRWRASGCGQWIDVACTTGQNEPLCTRVRVRGAESRITAGRAEAAAGADPEVGLDREAEAAAAGADPDVRRDRVEAERDSAAAHLGLDREAEPEAGAGADPPELGLHRQAQAEAEQDPAVRRAAEEALRQAIEARRDDVLACAPHDRVVVRVRTDANGAASVALGGDLAGSAEEGCVRAALDDLRAGPSLEVLHLVRR